jgi:hypothetical protein
MKVKTVRKSPPIMLRWTIYILRMLANLLGDPVDATMCQVCEGGGRKDGLVSNLSGQDVDTACV